jgi:hypothetical protein
VLFVLVLIALTSFAAWLFAVRILGLSPGRLLPALGLAAEAVGMALVFVVVNAATAVLIVLVARLVLDRHVSLYVAGDTLLITASLGQGLALACWCAASTRTTDKSSGTLE